MHAILGYVLMSWGKFYLIGYWGLYYLSLISMLSDGWDNDINFLPNIDNKLIGVNGFIPITPCRLSNLPLSNLQLTKALGIFSSTLSSNDTGKFFFIN
jgi:hypothetical protein